MAFWRFGFGTQSSIDTLLANAPSSRSMLNLGGSSATPGGPGGDAHDSNIPGPAAPGAPGSSTVPVSLERLLDEDDLLQECKNGHQKLTEFLSHPNILRRMLEYVSGAAFEESPMDQLGWPQSPSEEDTRLQHKIKYPHLCAEIILCDIHSIMSVLFADLDLFLAPFWKTVLDKSPQETAQQNIQMAHWSRVNSFLLSQRPIELLALIKSQPDFIEKLVLHLQSPPIADLLFRIIQCEEMPESQGIIHWLADRHLMSKLTEKLSPELPPATHMAASEFIRSVISFCSTANTIASNLEFAPRPTPQQQQEELEDGHPHTKWGAQQHQPQMPEMRTPIWVSNRLLSQLAEPEVCSRLLSYALGGDRGDGDDVPQESKEGKRKADDGPAQHELSNTPLTSEPASITFPTELPSPNDVHQPTATSSISSLVNCLSIFIDLIRKNNSDFTEQQIFQFMRKHDLLYHHQQKRAGKDEDAPRPPLPQGPSVVDLRPVLELMTQRLGDLHDLLKAPRSANSIQTAAGAVSPLSAERFKICELLAELFHCSNMALVNRTSTSITPEYDEAGYLRGGLESMPNLLAAISAPAQPGPSSDSLSDEAAATTGKQGAGASAHSAQEDKDLEAAAEKLELDDKEERENEDASASPEQSTSAVPKTKLSPTDRRSVGVRYRVAFLEQGLVPTAFNLFFQHPWHNFVHAVVYDLTQQVLTINIRTEVDSRLRESVFIEGHLTQRILDAQEENNVQTEKNKGRRLGYMGHLSLLAEEIVKVFASYPDLYELVKDKFDQEAWTNYVHTTLKELRAIDLQPLGGGVSMAVNDTISSSASSLSDEDEEYPGRVNRFGQGPGQTSGSKGVQGGSKLPSQFSQYFSQQMSGDRPPASTDSEEEDVWPQSRTSFAAPGVEPTSGSSVFDDDFGEFESPQGTPGDSGDPFAPKTRANLTSADWNSEFKSSFDEAPVSAADNPFASSDDDDFGDFQATPRITVPSFDSDSSYDFGGPGNGSFDVNTPLDGPDDGSAFFGGLRASSPEQPRTTPRADGLVEGHTSDGETVVVPPDEIELQAQEQRRKSISSEGDSGQ